MLICFLGIDGSGKTTYVTRLHKELLAEGVNCRYIHLEAVFIDKIFKIQEKVNAVRNMDNSVKIIQKQKRPSNIIFNSIKVISFCFLLFIDNFLFYLINFNKESKKILLCDRYFYDSIVTCICVSGRESFITTLSLQFFPIPDLIFLLDVKPDVAFQRKQEKESLSYLTQKRDIYLKICSELPFKVIKVNSSNDFAHSYSVVKSNVVEFIERGTNEK